MTDFIIGHTASGGGQIWKDVTDEQALVDKYVGQYGMHPVIYIREVLPERIFVPSDDCLPFKMVEAPRVTPS